jgi:hypothetical protein
VQDTRARALAACGVATLVHLLPKSLTSRTIRNFCIAVSHCVDAESQCLTAPNAQKYYYESLGKVPWEPWAKSHGSVGQSWLKDPTAQRDLLYQFTVALLDEMRQGYLRSLELSSLPGLDITKTMLTGNWPLRLEASLQLHITTKGGLLGNAASQASVSTRPTIPYEPRRVPSHPSTTRHGALDACSQGNTATHRESGLT